MEAGTGLHREPETPGLSFGLEARGGVGCAVLAKSCLVSGKLSLDSVILHRIAFPTLLPSSSRVSLLPWVNCSLWLDLVEHWDDLCLPRWREVMEWEPSWSLGRSGSVWPGTAATSRALVGSETSFLSLFS